MKDIQPEAIHAFTQPEVDDLEHRPLEVRVAVVQIRLEGQEGGPEILIPLRCILPAASAGHGQPVVGLIAPEIPVCFGIVS